MICLQRLRFSTGLWTCSAQKDISGHVTIIIFLFAPQINSVHCHCRSYLLLSSFHAVIQDFKEFF
uniref:Uncharacterized protein n=1 Tax=Calidris pygmaea TaxID=425635 RepID=A0A8C3PQ45_9CHAR